jgi:hypothetical protein
LPIDRARPVALAGVPLRAVRCGGSRGHWLPAA